MSAETSLKKCHKKLHEVIHMSVRGYDCVDACKYEYRVLQCGGMMVWGIWRYGMVYCSMIL